MISNGLAKKINIFCLLTAIVIVLVLPVKKEIWYDETVSMLCSKGISHSTPSEFSNINTANSLTIGQLNTSANVFNATVLDNANSFLYNILLHWFTLIFGNSIAVYMLFSKLCGITLLIAFYVLSNLFFRQSIFTSLAILLLATDNTIIGMSHEIRAYSMGAFFITLSAVYFFKFLFQKEKPFYLFLVGLFSAAAILSHFLSVYVVLVFLGALLFYKRLALFSVKNVLAILLPVGILAVFFFSAFLGLQIMSIQNHEILQKAHDFSLTEVLLRGMKFTAINFKAVFPAFSGKKPVFILSFLLIVSLYVAGIKSAADKAEKRNLHLLFLQGISGSLFLSLLCVKSHHYTALYFRYFSFCIPFSCLFTAYLLSVFFDNPRINLFIKGSLSAIIMIPPCVLFILSVYKANPILKYNHIAIASQIVRDKVVKIEVPEWQDAFLIQCVLPDGYKIDYVRNATSPYFTIYKAGTTEQVPVIRNGS